MCIFGEEAIADMNLTLDTFRLRFWTAVANAVRPISKDVAHEAIGIGRIAYNDVLQSIDYKKKVGSL